MAPTWFGLMKMLGLDGNCKVGHVVVVVVVLVVLDVRDEVRQTITMVRMQKRVRAGNGGFNQNDNGVSQRFQDQARFWAEKVDTV